MLALLAKFSVIKESCGSDLFIKIILLSVGSWKERVVLKETNCIVWTAPTNKSTFWNESVERHLFQIGE